MSLDVADRQAMGARPDDLVVDPIDPGLALLDRGRLEAAVAVTRNQKGHLAILALQTLAGRPVAPVALARRRLMPHLVAQVSRQLRTQHPLHQPDLQLLHQPGLAKQILRPLAAPQQLVQ